MNEIEKTINELRYQEDMRGKGVNYQVNNLVIATAISALEKQVPKKPKKYREKNIRHTSVYSCAACNGNFAGTGIADYCYHCGQKLDWSVEE